MDKRRTHITRRGSGLSPIALLGILAAVLTLLALAFVLVRYGGIAASTRTVANASDPSEEEYEDEYAEEDRATFVEELMKQEFMQTVDPETGTVPRERLWAARDLVKALKLAKRGDATSVTSDWEERGPSNVGGRTRALMFDPTDVQRKKVWAGSVSGGLWFNDDITNTAVSWQAVDDRFNNLAITSLAYDPNDSTVFYFATGEYIASSDRGSRVAGRGAGVWKSKDSGTSWTQLQSTFDSSTPILPNFYFWYVSKLVVHPDSSYLFAATPWSGVLRCASPCEGNSPFDWRKVLASGKSAAIDEAVDLEIGSDGTLYATMGIWSKGNIYRSDDKGLTWDSIGVAAGATMPPKARRIEIATAPSDADVLYAIVTHEVVEEGKRRIRVEGLYRTDDKGSSWTRLGLPRDVLHTGDDKDDFARRQGRYDLSLAVDPNNANRVFAGGVDLFKSTNGGDTWRQVSVWTPDSRAAGVPVVHADQHTVVYQPESSDIALFGNDGGVYVVTNAVAAQPGFDAHNKGYNVTQFYSAALHPDSGSDVMLAGAQDNGTQRFMNPGINETAEVRGGDGAMAFIDQDDPHIVISSYINNTYRRSNDGGQSFPIELINDKESGMFINPAGYADREDILFAARDSTSLYRVRNIVDSPTSAEVVDLGLGSIATHIRASPFAPDGTVTLFVGTQAGRIYRVENAESMPTLVEITPRNAGYRPANSASGSTILWISSIDLGEDEQQILFTRSNYNVTSVWESRDGGSTWANKDGDLPDVPVRWGMYNPNDRKEVLIATDAGIWEAFDIRSANPVWTPSTSAPLVRVDMLQYRPSDDRVMAATFGRGVWTATMGPGQGEVDVALVIDRSESMDSLNYIGPARDAAKLFLNLMRLDDRAAVVSFSSSVTVHYPLTSLVSEADRTAARTAVDQISAGGYTTIGGGIDRGLVELSKGPAGDVQAMVLLSDGIENQPPFAADVLPKVPDSLAIHTIALAGADQPLLMSIATQTGGTYALAPAPDSLLLQQLYDDIRMELDNAQLLARVRGAVATGASRSHDVVVDAGVRDARFTAYWSDGPLDFSLRAPDGRVITAGSSADGAAADWVGGHAFGSFVVSNPQPGRWRIVIQGADGSRPTAYAASVSAKTALRLSTERPRDRAMPLAGDSVRVAFSLLDDRKPVVGATVWADVLAPTAATASARLYPTADGTGYVDADGILYYEKQTVQLYDDGGHGDGTADDGVYANTLFAEHAGSYRVDALATASADFGELTRRSQFSFVALARGGTTGEDDRSEDVETIPEELTLGQSYPNPAGGLTNIAFTVPRAGRTTLMVYDLMGRRVAVVFDGDAEAGRRFTVPFDAGQLASGTYIYRLVFEDRTVSETMVVAH